MELLLKHMGRSVPSTASTARSPLAHTTSGWRSYLSTPLLYIFLALAVYADGILHLLSLLRLHTSTTAGKTLTHRLQAVRRWHVVWQTLRAHPHWRNTNCVRATEIALFNSIWLVVNDVIFGIISGLLLYKHSALVIEFFNMIHYKLTEDVLSSIILWLMGWPAGFKLNDNLDKFLGLLFLYYIEKWTVIMTALAPYCPLVLYIVSLSGLLGLSVLVSLLLDIFAFWTVHISCFYVVSARFHHLQLVLLSSLWTLFRGMKYNPLKKRIDSSDYDLDQLLLGTIVFTLLFFLFPTTALYYFFFAVLRLAIAAVNAVGALLLELLAHFPLYHLCQHATDPAFLPAGIRFDIVPQQYLPGEKATILTLKTQPLQLGAMFFHQRSELVRVFRLYTINKLVWCFITGASWTSKS
jgi:phosphatidylinositol glycan class Q protein